MANQAQREAMRHIDAAKRVYKTLQPTPFPSNELAVIPWVSNYEEYIRRVYGEDDAFKVNILSHMSHPRCITLLGEWMTGQRPSDAF